jgi:hypothetical protein
MWGQLRKGSLFMAFVRFQIESGMTGIDTLATLYILKERSIDSGSSPASRGIGKE